MEGGDRGPQTDKHLPSSTFAGQFFKKIRHLGFGVFVDIWSMMPEILGEMCKPALDTSLKNGRGGGGESALKPRF